MNLHFLHRRAMRGTRALPSEGDRRPPIFDAHDSHRSGLRKKGELEEEKKGGKERRGENKKGEMGEDAKRMKEKGK